MRNTQSRDSWSPLYLPVAGFFLSGCAHLTKAPLPPPPATTAQVQREVKFIRKSLFTDPCFLRLVNSAQEKPLPPDMGHNAIYSVEFPASPVISDGFSYSLEVTEVGRVGYLFTSGGIAGASTVAGPLQLSECLQEVFKAEGPELAAREF